MGAMGARDARLSRQLAEPAKRTQAWHECVLTAERSREAFEHRNPPAHRPQRNRKGLAPVMRTRDRVALGFEAEEVAVLYPVLLQEFIRLGCAGAEKDEAPLKRPLTDERNARSFSAPPGLSGTITVSSEI